MSHNLDGKTAIFVFTTSYGNTDTVRAKYIIFPPMENICFVLILRYVELIFLLSLEDAAELKPLEIKVSILVLPSPHPSHFLGNSI